MRRGAIVICGGRSSRMGVDKAFLPFGEGTMLEKILRTVGSVVAPQLTTIVAADNQVLPCTEVAILRDSAEYQGPLPAIAMGLEALASATDAVFVTGCDTPLLRASIIEYLFDRLDDFNCVVPQDAERLYPLCAVYRTSNTTKLQTFAGRSLHEFVATLDACKIPSAELRAIDPQLHSLHNVNTHEDYLSALAVAGISTP